MKSLYLAFLVLPLNNLLIEKIFSRSRMRQTADRWTHPKSGDGPVQPCPGCWLIPMSFSGGLPLANRRPLSWKSWDNPPCPQSWKPKLHWRSVSTLPLACVVQSLSSVRLFAMPWSAACQSPSFAISWSLLKLMSIQPSHPVTPSSSCPWSFPASGPFSMNWLFPSGGQSIGVSASASVLPVNIQDWFPLWWTGWISLQSKGLSRVFSNTTVRKYQLFGSQLSFFLFFLNILFIWLL